MKRFVDTCGVKDISTHAAAFTRRKPYYKDNLVFILYLFHDIYTKRTTQNSYVYVLDSNHNVNIIFLLVFTWSMTKELPTKQLIQTFLKGCIITVAI